MRIDKSISNYEASEIIKLTGKKKKNENELGHIGQNLNSFKLTETGLPELILALSNYFDLYPEKLRILGIFRVSGPLSEEEKLENELKENNIEYIFEVEDGKVIASFFFKDL